MIQKATAPVLALMFLVTAAVLDTAAQSVAPKTLPAETDAGVWTPIEVKDLSMRVTMPGGSDNLVDERFDAVRSLEALTRNGTYSVIVRSLDAPLENRFVGDYINKVVVGTLNERTKLLASHAVEYEGMPGKQVTYIENGSRIYARILFLNGRLMVLSVSFKNSDYRPEFDVWVDRFFDSFRVKVPLLVA